MVGRSTRRYEQGAHVREPFRSRSHLRLDHRCDKEFETSRGPAAFDGQQSGEMTSRHCRAFLCARTMGQCGLRGVRVGEASHPGPASKRRRTQRSRASQRLWDSDGESSSIEIHRGPTLVRAVFSDDECDNEQDAFPRDSAGDRPVLTPTPSVLIDHAVSGGADAPIPVGDSSPAIFSSVVGCKETLLNDLAQDLMANQTQPTEFAISRAMREDGAPGNAPPTQLGSNQTDSAVSPKTPRMNTQSEASQDRGIPEDGCS